MNVVCCSNESLKEGSMGIGLNLNIRTSQSFSPQISRIRKQGPAVQCLCKLSCMLKADVYQLVRACNGQASKSDISLKHHRWSVMHICRCICTYAYGNAKSAAKSEPVYYVVVIERTLQVQFHLAVHVLTPNKCLRKLLCKTSAASPTLGSQPRLHRHSSR